MMYYNTFALQYNDYSQELAKLIYDMLQEDKSKRPSVIDIICNPLLANTKAIFEYQQIHGVFSLGILKLNEEFNDEMKK